MNLKDLSLEQIIDKIKSKEISSQEVYNYFLWRIKKYDSKLNCFNYVNENWLQKNDDWILAWIPIWVKDLFCEKWVPTTWSSKMLKDFIPPYDATVIKNLKEEWMSSIWKLNNDEFWMWCSWENSWFKKTVNPWWKNRIPGGSSSWSASAVAAWLVPAALWTDTGWSCRQPAFMCWVVWFRPSYGRSSRFWVMPMASSFDCPWTVTKTVKDASILYEIMNWEDEKESTTIKWKDIINKDIWKTKDLKWIKIWIPKEYFWEWLDKWVNETIKKAIEDMKNMWAEIKEISLEMTKYAVAAYYIIVPAEVSTNLWRLDWIRYWHVSESAYENLDDQYINNRTEGLWIEAQRRTLVWWFVLSSWFYDAYFMKAAKVRTLIIEDFEKAFWEVDVIACPASPSVAWKIWDITDDPLKNYLADAFTIPASLAWLPGITIPCWFAKSEDEEKEELPVWIQLIWPYLWEERIFEVANVFEQNTKWKDKMIPKWFED